MKITLGDRVRFLNENIEGTVTRILDDKTVGVTTDDDFEIPVLKSDVVKVAFTEKSMNTAAATSAVTPKPKAPKPVTAAEVGLFALFEPKSDNLLHLHLANMLHHEVVYTYGTFDRKTYTTLKKGSLLLDESEVLATMKLEEFGEWPALVFNFIPCSSSADSVLTPVHKTFKPNAKEFHGSFKFSKILNKQCYVFRLDQQLNLVDLQQLRNRDFSAPATTGKLTPATEEVNEIVDLHLSAIPDVPKNLKAHEAIQVQIGFFKRQLEKGVAHGLEKMIFIHGIGDGVLKRNIREYLHRYPHAQLVQDADEFEYGKGATEVVFK
ncbi:MAG: Smr/MutS family protein [Bacteroidia bacterium]